MKINGASTPLRRQFLSMVVLACGAVASAILAIPVVGFILAPLLRKVPQQWVGIGPVTGFPVGEMLLVSYVDPSPLPWGGTTSKAAAYVGRTSENTWIGFSIHCTHLGCPVRWLPEARLFLCPCHGGVYYADGTVGGGPPPKHLVHVDLRQRDGQVELRTMPVPIT